MTAPNKLMIEHVAKAIATSHGRAYEMNDPDFRNIYEREAKAAIEAVYSYKPSGNDGAYWTSPDTKPYVTNQPSKT